MLEMNPTRYVQCEEFCDMRSHGKGAENAKNTPQIGWYTTIKVTFTCTISYRSLGSHLPCEPPCVSMDPSLLQIVKFESL